MIILAADTERDQEMLNKFQRAYENMRKIVDRLEDENRKLNYEHKRSMRFVDNLLKRKQEWLFGFVMDPCIEKTNNRAERALRPSVIYRKVSGGSRSERGAEIYTRIYSVYYTSKLRGKNFITDTPYIMRGDAKPG